MSIAWGQTIFSDSQWQKREQWAQTETQKVPPDYEEKFSLRVAEHWNKLPREVVKSSSSQIFQTWLGVVPASCCRWTCFGRRGWTRSPQIPWSTNCAVIMWIWIWKGFYHLQLPLKLLHLCREQMLSPADIWLKHMAVDLEVRNDINKICMTWNNITQHYI